MQRRYITTQNDSKNAFKDVSATIFLQHDERKKPSVTKAKNLKILLVTEKKRIYFAMLFLTMLQTLIIELVLECIQ